jgi:type IV pilus assembly protein PilV
VRRPVSSERGFTLMEIMVSLVITVIGLAGVLMMQANTVKSNRVSGHYSRAANIAEETMEAIRGTKISELTANPTYTAPAINGVTYTIATTAAAITDQPNLVLLTVDVSYVEDDSTISSSTRHAKVQLIRTRTETL